MTENFEYTKFTKKESKIINSLDFGEAVVFEAVFDNPDVIPKLFINDFCNVSREANRNVESPFVSFIVCCNRFTTFSSRISSRRVQSHVSKI